MAGELQASEELQAMTLKPFVTPAATLVVVTGLETTEGYVVFRVPLTLTSYKAAPVILSQFSSAEVPGTGHSAESPVGVQGVGLQAWEDNPVQLVPPQEGAGLVQVLVCVPPPHEREH